MMKKIYLTACIVMLTFTTACHAGLWEDMRRALGLDTTERDRQRSRELQGEMFRKEPGKWIETYPEMYKMYVNARIKYLLDAKIDPKRSFTADNMKHAQESYASYEKGLRDWAYGRSLDIDTPFILLRESAELLCPDALDDICEHGINPRIFGEEASTRYKALSQQAFSAVMNDHWGVAKKRLEEEARLKAAQAEADNAAREAARVREEAERRASDESTSVGSSGITPPDHVQEWSRLIPAVRESSTGAKKKSE